MRTLVIVESPAKAKTIEKYLGKEFKVVSSVGHIRNLPKSDKDAIDIKGGFVPHYEVIPDKQKIINQIQKEAAKADEVLLATDPDREGEAIAWHIQQAVALKNPKRIVFHEITKEAILESLKHIRLIDQDLRIAQEARRVLDRLFGYSLSKLIWKKVRYGLSAGRVQSPALRIIMEQERKIRAFTTKVYWELQATFQRKDASEYITECEKTFDDKKEVDAILKKAKKAEWSIGKIKKTLQKRLPRAPFITSTLQQAANTVLGWSPANTMRVAQRLYERGHITYMRTDSTNLSKQAHEQIKKVITETYGKEQYHQTHYKTKSKAAQEAHEAIRPTVMAHEGMGSSQEERSLYTIIYRRTLASQMIPAELERTVVSFTATGMPTFLLRGVRIIQEGWLACDDYAKNKEVHLPVLTEGEPVTCNHIQPTEKETTPPPRYSEAGLVKELEARGIGRPSTYASTIRTLVERNYVVKESRSLVPTDLGDVVSSFLEKHFSHYVADAFTSDMEDALDTLAVGKGKYKTLLKDFYTEFKKEVDAKEDIEKLTTLRDGPPEHPCPKCKGKMVYKLSKTDTFLSCANFPTCTGARKKDGELIKEPKEIGKDCPKCRDGALVLRSGRFGDFISCNRYPKCKYIEEDPETKAKRDTQVTCVTCKKGTIVERQGRFGPFYGCSDYPTCKYTMRAKPTGTTCTECGSLMMEGTKTIPTRCSSKTCPYHNPHKLKH